MEWSLGEMIERANEELEMLETQHPNRFEYLKLELRSFISLLQSQPQHSLLPVYPASSIVPASSSLTTQASTSRKRKKKKKKKGPFEMKETMSKFQRVEGDMKKTKADYRVDLVLERAKSCLQKIQELKSSLCC